MRAARAAKEVYDSGMWRVQRPSANPNRLATATKSHLVYCYSSRAVGVSETIPVVVACA